VTEGCRTGRRRRGGFDYGHPPAVPASR
jgi:hypothetical protein